MNERERAFYSGTKAEWCRLFWSAGRKEFAPPNAQQVVKKDCGGDCKASCRDTSSRRKYDLA